MKTAEEILREYDLKCYSGACHKELFSTMEVEGLIRQTQRDAIEETVRRCADKSITKSFKLSKYSKSPRWKKVEEEEEVDLFAYDFKTEVDKQSIRKVADELKRELGL